MEHEIEKTLNNDDQLEKGVQALNNALLNFANRNERTYLSDEDECEFDIEMECVSDHTEKNQEPGDEKSSKNNMKKKLFFGFRSGRHKSDS